MPPLCKFFQQGNCKFGDQCRFEHSRGGGSGPPPGPRGNQPRNSFEPLENRISSFGGGGRGNNQALSRGGGHGQAFGGGGRGGRGDHYGSNRGNLFSSGRGDYRGSGRGGFRSRGGGGQFSRNNQSDTPNSYGLRSKILLEDLQQERPMWVASCYGPGNHPPRQLMGGWPLEQSPEELRLLHYCGNAETSLQNESELAMQANKQAQEVINDPNGAIQYLVDGEQEHPNRKDIAAESKKGHRLGLFSRDNQRRRIGVFSDQSRHPPGGPSNWATGLGQENVATSGDFFRPLDGPAVAPMVNQQPQSRFGIPQTPADMQMNSPEMPQQDNGFSVPSCGIQNQPFGTGHQDQFFNMRSGFDHASPGMATQPQMMQPNPPQPSGFPQTDNSTNIFPQAPSGPAGGIFARQEEGLGVNGINSNTMINAPAFNGGLGAFGHSNPSSDNIGHANRDSQGNTAGTNGLQLDGLRMGPNGDSVGGDNDLRALYQHLAQSGQFKDGIVPETAPRKEWIGF